MKETRKFYLLEFGRGIAAILVLLFHIDRYYFNSDKYWADDLIGGIFRFGHSGVQFFFVLSGFIMIWAHYDDLGRTDKIYNFLVKRFIRIYPMVWLTVGVSALLYVASGSGNPTYHQPLFILQSLLLVGREPLGTINFPTWTLWHENLFYFACVMIIARPRIGLAVLALWSIACISVTGLMGSRADTFYVLRPENSLFALGVACAYWLRKRRVVYPSAILAIGAAIFFVFGVSTNARLGDFASDNFVYGISSVLIIIGGVEAQRQNPLVFPSSFAILGTLSFPLYLTHMITLPFVAKALRLFGATQWMPTSLAGMIMAVASIIVALLVHRIFERPVTDWLQQNWIGRLR